MDVFVALLIAAFADVAAGIVLWMGIRGAFSIAISIGRALEPHPPHSGIFDGLEKTANNVSVVLAIGLALLAWAIIVAAIVQMAF